MENINLTQVAIAFGGLLVLLGLFWFVMRALSGSPRFGKWRPGQRIGVVDSAPVDGSRRLLLVRRDEVEHLLLLSNDGDLVIETGIPVTRTEPDPAVPAGGWPTLRVPGREPGREPGPAR